MNTRILSIAAVAVISTQSMAMSNSGWSFSAAYGVLMPTDSKQTWTTKDNTAGGTPLTPAGANEFKMKNTNYFDVNLTHSKSGFGLMYSSSAKDTAFTPTNVALNNDKFVWKYRGYYATYNHPLGQMLDMNLAVGSVKQTLKNTAYTATETAASNRDLGARVGIGAFYNLSKEAALKLSLAYHYFKEFKTEYKSNTTQAQAASEISSAVPKIDASGLAGSIALVYNM